MKKLISRIGVLIVVVLVCVSACACSLGLAGKSAYEIACENGFAGTEQEWLASLVGKDGQDAQEIDIYTLFDAYLELYPETSFEEFLRTFISSDYYDTEYAAAKGLQSAMRVRSRFQTRSGGLRPTTTTYYSEGSGVVYKIEGAYAYIITNYHMVYDYDSITQNKIADEILVYSYGSETSIKAEYVGGSASKDVAVIKTVAASLPDFMKTADIADSNSVTPGMRSVAVGNPLAYGISVSSGIVSVDSEEIEMDALDSAGSTIVMRVIRTDTAINSGNSGGGLFNSKGELIGIVNAKTVLSGVENIGYAIPINVAAGIADCVIDNDSKKCILGITVAASASVVTYDSAKNSVAIIESVVVDSITAGGLADGVLQKGDLLLSVKINNDEFFSITRIFHLSDYLYKARQGDILSLEINRGGEILILQMTVGSGNFSLV